MTDLTNIEWILNYIDNRWTLDHLKGCYQIELDIKKIYQDNEISHMPDIIATYNNINKINYNNNIKTKSTINQFPLKLQTKTFNSTIELTKSFCSSLNENNKIQLGLLYSFINSLINLTHIDTSLLKISIFLNERDDLLSYLLESTIDSHNPVHDRHITNSFLLI